MEADAASVPVASVDPEQPPTTYSPLMDRLPVEIRLNVFRYVFRRDITVVEPIPGGLLSDTRPRASTDPFAVSRQVRDEAQDAFCDVFTIIATDPLPTGLLPLVRRIEFRRDESIYFWPDHILRACSSKLISITLARENLSAQSTVREWFEAHKPDYRLECIGMGLFKAVPENGHGLRVFVKDFEVCKALAHARQRGATLEDVTNDFTACARQHRTWDRNGRNSEQHPGANIARLVLAAYEARKMAQSGVEVPYPAAIFIQLWNPELVLRKRKNIEHRRLPHEVRITDLNVADHGPKLVEWATELLALSTRALTEEALCGSL